MTPIIPPVAPVLLYDGNCGFCADSVQRILRHDRVRRLRFAALDSDFGRAVRSRHPALGEVDSIVWVEPAFGGRPERVLVRSRAALRIARYLGGWWRLGLVALMVPRVLGDRGYDMVARHRHRLGGAPRCFLPTDEDRGRFLP